MSDERVVFAIEVTDCFDTPFGFVILGRASNIPAGLVREEPYRVSLRVDGTLTVERTKALISVSKDRLSSYSSQILRGQVAVRADSELIGLFRGAAVHIQIMSRVEADHSDYDKGKVRWTGMEA